MKRRDIIKKLQNAGLEIREVGKYVSAIPRHNEIAESTAKAIERQTGVKLK